jgi:hypothetical protein
MIYSLLFALSAFACPDFSGHYYSLDEDIDLTLNWSQVGCASARGVYDHGDGGYVQDRALVFDGVQRPLENDGSYEWTEGFVWDGDVIRVKSEYHSKVTNSRFSTKGSIARAANGNLVEETAYFDENGKETQRNTFTYIPRK